MLCGVVAESADTISGAAMTASVFAIMNNVKHRLGDVVHHLMTLQKDGGTA
jgi:hypothetical protein